MKIYILLSGIPIPEYNYQILLSTEDFITTLYIAPIDNNLDMERSQCESGDGHEAHRIRLPGLSSCDQLFLISLSGGEHNAARATPYCLDTAGLYNVGMRPCTLCRGNGPTTAMHCGRADSCLGHSPDRCHYHW